MGFIEFSSLEKGQKKLSSTQRLEEICIHISAVTENGLNHSLDAILVNYVGTKPNFAQSKKEKF